MTDLRVALIGGAGFMGKAHSLALSHAAFLDTGGITVTREVLVDVNAESAAAAARSLGWKRSSTSWQEVVADPSIDIIDIVTPPHLHAPIAIAALAAGKHVFCEKPLTNKAVEAIELAARAAESGRVAQVGFNYRHTPILQHMKSMLDRGALGKPLQLRASYLVDGGFWVPDFGWRARRSTGGSGASGDLGSHVIDMALCLCGRMTRVVAQSRTYSGAAAGVWDRDGRDTRGDAPDMGAVWLAEFENGAMGTFSASFYAAGRKNALRVELDGSKGAMQFDWNKNNEIQLVFVDEPPETGGFRSVITADPSVWYPIPGMGYGYVDGAAAQMVRFIRSIAQGEAAAPGFADAAHVQQVVEAIARSSATGAWVAVPA